MSKSKILNHKKYAMDVALGDPAEGFMYGWQIKELYPEYYEYHRLDSETLYEIS